MAARPGFSNQIVEGLMNTVERIMQRNSKEIAWWFVGCACGIVFATIVVRMAS